ncbi:hypothetical protein NitYY0814_C0344 [Nitratiruptor sp. YY08-14]|uniref:hypothetical protein n=1 Tax=Nitratiruptor sp. YY08-14 TaxID=2724899 RepID=UPI00191679EB|nr:hypothetical protein [Nitratiruptor sp. YY08-14]BCD63517.1 hypothetical protein NitYY0814_C0344 [Nitratiruptor sp. YY08-14]BCD83135.1 hypothetical protein NrS3_19 [Nitratiruptor phage NrS-3]
MTSPYEEKFLQFKIRLLDKIIDILDTMDETEKIVFIESFLNEETKNEIILTLVLKDKDGRKHCQKGV